MNAQLEGIALARKRGVPLGRPRLPVDAQKLDELREQGLSLRAASKEMGISVATAHRVLREWKKSGKIRQESATTEGQDQAVSGGMEGTISSEAGVRQEVSSQSAFSEDQNQGVEDGYCIEDLARLMGK